MPQTDFRSLIQFFLSIESLPQRHLIAKQIIDSLNDIRLDIDDVRLHKVALEVLVTDLRKYSGDLSDAERELLRSEIGFMVDMITL